MRKRILFFMSVALLLLTACNTTNNNVVETVSPTLDTEEMIDLIINDSVLSVSLTNANEYHVTSLSVLTDNYINYESNENYEIYLNDVMISGNQEETFSVEKIDTDYKLELKIVNRAEDKEIISYINTYPKDLDITPIEDNQDGDGFYYFAPRGYALKMNTDGELVYYRTGNALMNFNRTEVDGQVFYSYSEGVSVEEHPKLEDAAYGTIKSVVMDENFRIIDEVTELISTENVPSGMPLDSHQFEILGENHYLISAYVAETVTNFPDGVSYNENGANVVNAVVQEIKDGELIFEWSSTAHPELYAYSVRENDYHNEILANADYTHFNCATIDPKDGNLLLSLKNLDAILKVDRTTSEIIWILGGVGDQFGITDEQFFLKQHDVRVTEDGAITLFDNGGDDENESGQTRVVKFYLNEEEKTIEDFYSYQIDNVFTYSMGSALEIEEGQYVISWGKTLESYYMIQEIDFNTNEVLFSVGLNEVAPTYKAFKYAE